MKLEKTNVAHGITYKWILKKIKQISEYNKKTDTENILLVTSGRGKQGRVHRGRGLRMRRPWKDTSNGKTTCDYE